MGILFSQEHKVFQITTQNTEYCIGIADDRYIGHIYYGKRLDDLRCGYLMRTKEPPFVPSANRRDKGPFMDVFPFEYPTWGVGDYRESCLKVRTDKGACGCELHYVDHRITEGKPKLPGLPATFEGPGAGKGQTLEIFCRDSVIGLKVVLRYSVFADSDALIRSVSLENESQSPLHIEKVLSACLDMDGEGMERLTLNGSWCRERRMERSPIAHGKQAVSSLRGESSHQEHPFLAVMEPGANQDQGQVYAMNFVYSGNFLAQTEKSQFDSLRVVMGIHPEGFEWVLDPGESFTAPEVVCVYSDQGLGRMSLIFHDLYRNHLIRSPYLHQKRPVLINNWEATYFDFDSDKLLAIAREAKKSGIEMLVMDDGWFGNRKDDYRALGDWYVNEEKLGESLDGLVKKINELGLKFGIWFEPEGINEDSDLFRAHPDWALTIPGRDPMRSRNQLLLDFSRKEVVDHVFEQMCRVLDQGNIEYVKWDLNRSLSDCFSRNTADQGRVQYDYMIGLYDFLERLLQRYPDLLLEGCSGGGGRFDAGMLYYSPQIWCSDNSDAIERVSIQYGTSFGYPVLTMGAHVSAVPNHQTGRVTPFHTRGVVAMSGAFGYELDPKKLSEEEKQAIREQIREYKQYGSLMQKGLYYRLTNPAKEEVGAWEFVSQDGDEALVSAVMLKVHGNMPVSYIRLKGLKPDSLYREQKSGKVYPSDALMEMGIPLPVEMGEYRAYQMYFIKVEE